MQTPVRESEPTDFQELYRKHVHENMLLHERMKVMSNVEKSKIRELNNEMVTFKSKYNKYCNNDKRCKTMDFKSTFGEKQCRHRSAFLVCKDLAYPAKAWHDLVDVSKPGLDVYKTEILRNTVGERLEHEPSYSGRKLVRRRSIHAGDVHMRKSEFTDVSKVTVMEKSNDHGQCCPVWHENNTTEFFRSNTLPVITVSKTEHSDRSHSVNKTLSSDLPRIDEPTTNHDESTAKLRYSPRLGSMKPCSCSEESLNDHACVDRLSSHRERSNTIDTTYRATTPYLHRRRSSSIHAATDVSKGLRKLKLASKLISVSFNLLNNARETEIKKTAKSFEDLRHCRYLRHNDGEDLDAN